MTNQSNAWTFTGIVQRLETMTSKKSGKSFVNLSITQTDGQYTRLCVCTLFSRPPEGLTEGAYVTATGRIDGREYNGKHYAGLTASAVVVAGAQQEARPAEPEQGRSVDRANAQMDLAAEGAEERCPF